MSKNKYTTTEKIAISLLLILAKAVDTATDSRPVSQGKRKKVVVHCHHDDDHDSYYHDPL